MTSFAVVGAGWRAPTCWRLAAAPGEVECSGAVVRTPRDLPVRRGIVPQPCPGRRLNADEIATGTLLTRMAAWVVGSGPSPYPPAEAAHDHLIALAVEEAADTDRTVTVPRPPWQ